MTKPLTPEQTAAKKLAARTCSNCGKVFRKAASIAKFHGWCKARTEADGITATTEAVIVPTNTPTPTKTRRSRKAATVEATVDAPAPARSRKLPVLTTQPVQRVKSNAVPVLVTRVK